MTIYYINPANRNYPYGGVKKLYDHVRILGGLGISASIIQAKPGFRPTWFDSSDVDIRYAPVTVTNKDVLAFPEMMGAKLASVAPGVPRLSVNQNAHYTFDPRSPTSAHPYILAEGLLGILAVSDHTERFLKHAFPTRRIWRFRVSVDVDTFKPLPVKERVICYMPRKRARDVASVIGLLTTRGSLSGWELRRLDGMTEGEVAKELGRASIFLSFSEQEGCPLPPLEAMACETLVVGYTGFGAAEYMTGDAAVPVPEGDILSFCDAVEGVVSTWESDREHWGALRRKASEVVKERYSYASERLALAALYAEIVTLEPPRETLTRSVTRMDASSPADPVLPFHDLRQMVANGLTGAASMLTTPGFTRVLSRRLHG
jgi:hypothetical protein